MTKERTQQGSLIASVTMLALGTVSLSLLSTNIASAQNRPLSILNHEGDGQMLADSNDRPDNYDSGTTSEERQNNDSEVERDGDRTNHDDDDDDDALEEFRETQIQSENMQRNLGFPQYQQQNNTQRHHFRRNYERMRRALPPRFRY